MKRDPDHQERRLGGQKDDTIAALFDEFDPLRALQYLSIDPGVSRLARSGHLVVFAMLVTWALWPVGPESQIQVRRGARNDRDTLVHNLLDRTGMLTAYDAQHAYGPACYADGNCADIVRELAGQVDARTLTPVFPRYFPRLVQHALWRFCAQQELDICNGVRVSKSETCEVTDCPNFGSCERSL